MCFLIEALTVFDMTAVLAFGLFILAYSVNYAECAVESTVKTTTTTTAAASNCTQELREKFEIWKKKFNKTYTNPAREAKRREIFCTNFNRIKKHNAANKKSYKRGINIHSDKTFAERTRNLLGAKRVSSDDSKTTTEKSALKISSSLKTTSSQSTKKKKATKAMRESSTSTKSTSTSTTTTTTTTPKTSTVDHSNMMRFKKLKFNSFEIPNALDFSRNCTPVKDQFGCGACWAFAAVAVLEFWRNTEGKYATFSEQDIIDCNDYEFSCDGGWSYEAFLHAINHGLSDGNAYIYMAQKNNECLADAYPDVIKIDHACEINLNGDEKLLKKIIAEHGPVAGVINVVDSFYQYSSGIFYEPSCTNDTFNHGIAIVGYGTDPTHGDYWIIRNSWSSSWGMNGYAWMARNKENHCAIASFAMFPCRAENHDETQKVKLEPYFGDKVQVLE